MNTTPHTQPPWWTRRTRLPLNYRTSNGLDRVGFQLTAMWAPMLPCTVERRVETVAAWWRALPTEGGREVRDKRLLGPGPTTAALPSTKTLRALASSNTSR